MLISDEIVIKKPDLIAWAYELTEPFLKKLYEGTLDYDEEMLLCLYLYLDEFIVQDYPLSNNTDIDSSCGFAISFIVYKKG